MLIDNGESCLVKGLRICKEFEGGKLFPIMSAVGSEWAKYNGASIFVSTNTDTIRAFCKPVAKMVNYTYI